MGIKPSLDDSEKAVIVLLNKQKMSISEIIRKIGRSHVKFTIQKSYYF